MKHLLSVVIMLAIAGRCGAGTITTGNISHRLSIKETCANGFCAATLRFSLITSLEADLSPAEADGFSPDTLIQASFPLGPSGSFRLADDPNYVAGATSVSITTTTLFNKVTWKRTIDMRWDGGKLRLAVKVSVNQSLIHPAPVEWESVVKNRTKIASPSGTLISLLADNLGTEFLSLKATVVTKTKTLNSIKTKPTGETKLLSNQSIRGSKLEPG